MNPLVITISLAVIAVSSLAGAIYLQATGNDSSQAWAGFLSSVGLLVGQQIPSPTTGGK